MPQPLVQDQNITSNFRTEPSLYRRLGGYDVIAAIIDNVIARLRTDPRFSGAGDYLHLRGRHQLVGRLCELAGGPCIYLSSEFHISSSGMGFTEKGWKATRKYMARTLSDLHVARRESDEVIALWTRHKDEIVDNPIAH